MALTVSSEGEVYGARNLLSESTATRLGPAIPFDRPTERIAFKEKSEA